MTEAEMDAALEAGAPGMTGIVVGREAFEAIAYENVMAWDAMREANARYDRSTKRLHRLALGWSES